MNVAAVDVSVDRGDVLQHSAQVVLHGRIVGAPPSICLVSDPRQRKPPVVLDVRELPAPEKTAALGGSRERHRDDEATDDPSGGATTGHALASHRLAARSLP